MNQEEQMNDKPKSSLDTSTGKNQQADWLIEANRRATQLDINPALTIPLKTVMQKARQPIKQSHFNAIKSDQS